MASAKTFNVGLIGAGIVGGGVIKNLTRNADLIADRLGVRLQLKWVCDKDDAKLRGIAAPVCRDAQQVLNDPDVHAVVELIGGTGFARQLILDALARRKVVVTANKALLAHHGEEIFAAAAQHRANLFYEASVGGGIPIIKALREGFVANQFPLIYGIVNGTCNYILSQMEKSGKPYAEALEEAQQKGYAETNPAADVSGGDAEAKLLLLSLVAFGLQIEPGKIWRKGIEDIQAVDFRYAARIGGTIKQLAVARRNGGAVQAFVAPALVPKENFLAGIDGATNAVCFAGKSSGAGRGERDCDYVLVGPGAGGGPTAVAVLGDVCELARGERKFAGAPSLIPAGALKLEREDDIDAPFYIRFVVKDRAGIVGDIGRTFGRMGINISEIWQLRHVEEELRGLMHSYRLKPKPGEILPFVMTLERTTLRRMRKALLALRHRDYIAVDPVWFPMWGVK